jgi:homoserine dehydrogenase
MPILFALSQSRQMDEVLSVSGILNGTTNYMLDAMQRKGCTYEDALKTAQQLGYAEKDPSADIHGFDAQRKIMILCAVATGYIVEESKVYTETMSKVTVEDIEAARRLGGAVRLIGSFRREESGVAISVCPRIVPGNNPLSGINDVYNGMSVTSRLTGDVMYYGRGAGRYPTAGAVIADVIAALNGAYKMESHPVWEAAPADFVCDFADSHSRVYVRVSGAARGEVLDSASLLLGDVEIPDGTPEGKVEFITGILPEKLIAEAIGKLPGKVEAALRFLI